eukprot:TRINITY_DN3720_c0_g1_i1.p1 TRINITY_DN3720_c0_g1~~TRINITY_DN3720_c0_g1_i1.p1  ORF type:complete len:540 (-),score=44.79 TRINITY_DN3720_c0_g1_i1:149-1768(-)
MKRGVTGYTKGHLCIFTHREILCKFLFLQVFTLILFGFADCESRITTLDKHISPRISALFTCAKAGSLQTCSLTCSGTNCISASPIECGEGAQCSIICATPQSCFGITVNCANSSQCSISCRDESSCLNATIICPNSGECGVECTKPSSCKNAKIAQPTEVTCSDNNACTSAQISSGQDLKINCIATDSCQNVNITAKSLDLTCTSDRSCFYAGVAAAESLKINCSGSDSCRSIVAKSKETSTNTCKGQQSCYMSSISAKQVVMQCDNSQDSCTSSTITTSNTLNVTCNSSSSCDQFKHFCVQSNSSNSSVDQCCVNCIGSCGGIAYSNSTPCASSMTPAMSVSPSATAIASKMRSSPVPSPGLVVINGTLNLTTTTFVVNQTVLVVGSLDGENTTIIFPVDAGGLVKVEGNISISGVVVIQLGANGLVNSKEIPIFEFAADNFANIDLVYQIVRSDGSPLGECEDVDVVQTKTSISLAVTLKPKGQKQGCGDEESSDDNTGTIVGIVIGTVVGVFIVVVVIVLVILIIWKVKFKSDSF